MKETKLLLVDDESIHQLAIMDIIEADNSDYEVLSAFDGHEALAIALKEMPDLIITDWEMPVMSGLEFIRTLKKEKETADIPVLMCTGVMTSSANLQLALEAGANDFIRKPIDEVELRARLHANLHLSEKYREIKKLNAHKDRVFSVIAHDLRGPVGTFKGLTDLMLANIKTYPLEKIEEITFMINKQCISVYSMLENLLEWAKSQQQKIKYEPIQLVFAEVVEENKALFDVMAAQKGLTIKNNVPSDFTATCDPAMIASVLKNLINNAIKFSVDGGIIAIDVQPGHDYHTIIVSDMGLGIKPEVMAKLFDKTTFTSTFGTNNEKGSGLGLKLCQEFIEMHHGQIWVESQIGHGSQFYFTLPV